MVEAFMGCAGQVQLPEGYLKQVFKLVFILLYHHQMHTLSPSEHIHLLCCSTDMCERLVGCASSMKYRLDLVGPVNISGYLKLKVK